MATGDEKEEIKEKSRRKANRVKEKKRMVKKIGMKIREK